MTGEEALKQAQEAYPLDLVGRLRYIRYQWDNSDPEDMPAWEDAWRLTRGWKSLDWVPPVLSIGERRLSL